MAILPGLLRSGPVDSSRSYQKIRERKEKSESGVLLKDGGTVAFSSLSPWERKGKLLLFKSLHCKKEFKWKLSGA